MPKLQIKNYRTGTIIFEGTFVSARECVESAARQGVCLDYADLRHANLQNAALDDIVMRHARLDHANLTGANLSEADLTGASFAGASLQASCLCFSRLRTCNFDGAEFGATDIAGADLGQCRFSGLSVFSLNFIDADNLDGCVYRASPGIPCAFSRPPLFIQGLGVPVAIFDRQLKLGHSVRTFDEWARQTNDNVPSGYAELLPVYRALQENLGGLLALRGAAALLDAALDKAAQS